MDFVKPKTLAEANIQAEIYRQCKDLLIECYLEYTFENCRFDIIIVKNNKILGIVEVKRAHHIMTKKKLKLQREKYLTFGVPVHVCFHAGDIPNTMKTITKWLTEQPDILTKSFLT